MKFIIKHVYDFSNYIGQSPTPGAILEASLPDIDMWSVIINSPQDLCEIARLCPCGVSITGDTAEDVYEELTPDHLKGVPVIFINYTDIYTY